jgi:hypothetical protein
LSLLDGGVLGPPLPPLFFVNVTDIIPLFVMPDFIAMALIVVVAVRVIAAVYTVELAVGVEPSSV